MHSQPETLPRFAIAVVALLFVGAHTPAHGAPTTLAIERAIIFRTVGTVDVTGIDGEKRSVARPITLPPKPSPDLAASEGQEPTAYTAPKGPGPAVVLPGEIIATSEKSICDLVIPEVGTFRLAEKSKLLITPPKTEDGEESKSSVEHLRGRTMYSIAPKERGAEGSREFRVKTPRAILGIRGTRFFVESTAGFDVAGVHRGAVAVTESVAGKVVELEKETVCYAKPETITEARPMNKEQLALAELYDEFELRPIRLKFAVAEAGHSWVAPLGEDRDTTLVAIDSGFRWTIPGDVGEGHSAQLGMQAELPPPGEGREFAHFMILKARGRAVTRISHNVSLTYDGQRHRYRWSPLEEVKYPGYLPLGDEVRTYILAPYYFDYAREWRMSDYSKWPDELSKERFGNVIFQVWDNSLDREMMEKSPELENYEVEVEVLGFSYGNSDKKK